MQMTAGDASGSGSPRPWERSVTTLAANLRLSYSGRRNVVPLPYQQCQHAAL